jgi:hypothetical protein
MKISKILSGFMCAGILCCSVAQASVIAESKVSVENLTLTFFDAETGGSQLVPGVDVVLSDVDISFTGTSVSTSLNGVADGESYSTPVTNVFDPISVDISSTQTSGADSASAGSTLNGNILSVDGAIGSTDSKVNVYGVSNGDANSQILNNLETTFAFTVAGDVWVDLSFDWMLDVFVEIFDEGGTGNATWGLTVTLGLDCFGFGCSDLIEFDISDDVGGDQTGTLNTVGDLFDGSIGGTFDESRKLLSTGAYTLAISQDTSAAASSVSAPASLAILSLGLLGVAGFSRRNTK